MTQTTRRLARTAVRAYLSRFSGSAYLSRFSGSAYPSRFSGSAYLPRFAGSAYLPRSLARACLPFVLACSGAPDATVRLPENSATRKGEDPPVMVNPQTPVEYPAALFARGIEGKVILRLYADSSGTLAAESTRVAESSGYPALDSAALAAVPQFRFAPALRDGEPAASAFLQPVHFRHPQAGGTTP